MSGLKYQLSQPDLDVLEGVASKVFLKDKKNVLTISSGHAPLIAMLEEGYLELYSDSKLEKQVSYNEGFLTLSDGICQIHILR